MSEAEKQIAEMAVKCCTRNPQAHTAEECLQCEFKNGMCDIYKLAKTLYKEDYRKASEVAREIFAEIETSLKFRFIEGETHLTIRKTDYDTYKKKYESEGGE